MRVVGEDCVRSGQLKRQKKKRDMESDIGGAEGSGWRDRGAKEGGVMAYLQPLFRLCVCRGLSCSSGNVQE